MSATPTSMLNAFQPLPIFELPAKERTRIDSLLAYGDKLILSLSSGSLRTYRINTPSIEPTPTDSTVISPEPVAPVEPLTLLSTRDSFSAKKIELLAAIKEANSLISLSDGTVSIHDLSDYSHITTLSKARRATTFAVTSNIEKDEETGIPEIVSRLAVAVKKRVCVWEWRDGGMVEGKEIVLGGNVRTLTWASSGRKVVVGLQGGFWGVDVESGEAGEIAPPEKEGGEGKVNGGEGGGWASYVGMGGWGSRSLATRIGGDEILLLKDSTTLVVDGEGKPVVNRQPVGWSTPPDQIAYSYPYLISLHTGRQVVEVRNPATKSLLQSIQLPTVTTLHVPPPNVSLMHAGKLFFVASPTQVWRMVATDYEEQINELIEKGELDEAIKLIEGLEDVLLKERKEEKLREVQMLKAEKLFQRKRYEESMILFGDVSAPPERVVKLFPRSIAGELSIWPDEEEERKKELEEAEAADEEGETQEGDGANDEDPATKETEHQPPSGSESGEAETESEEKPPEITPVRPRPISRVNTSEHARKPSNGDSTSILNSPPSHLQHHLKSHPNRFSDTASIFSFGTRRAKPPPPTSLEPIDETPKPLTGNDLREAALSLASRYLNDIRRKMTKYFSPATGIPLDPLTILTSASSSKSDPLESSFLSLPPDLSPEEASKMRIEKLLLTTRTIDTALFRVYVLYRPTLVGSLVRLHNNIDPDVVSQALREQGKFIELVDFLEKKSLHREALELLRFFATATDGDTNITIPPALKGWSRTITYLTRLGADKIDLIIEFAPRPLQEVPDAAMEIFTGDTGNSSTLPRVPVLEFLERTSPHLALQYLTHIITTLHDNTPDFHTKLASLYLQLLPSTPSLHAPFLDFLKSTPHHYRADRVLTWLPRDLPQFFEPRAVVLSKLGQHKKALEIYVFKLHDYPAAEDYCLNQFLTSPPKMEKMGESPFHTLLDLYLAPPTEFAGEGMAEELRAPALGVLSRHGARLDPAIMLQHLPGDVRMVDLRAYFEKRMRTGVGELAEGAVGKGLREVRRGEVRERLLIGDVGVAGGKGDKGRARGWVVKEGTVCRVCHKRLGGSVCVWVPPGAVGEGEKGGEEGVGVGKGDGEGDRGQGGLVHYGCRGGRRTLGIRGGF